MAHAIKIGPIHLTKLKCEYGNVMKGKIHNYKFSKLGGHIYDIW